MKKICKERLWAVLLLMLPMLLLGNGLRAGATSLGEPENCKHDSVFTVEDNRIEASCTEDGSYEAVTYCLLCKKELDRYREVIPASGHTEGETREEDRIEPGCTDPGSVTLVVLCSICGDEVSRESMTLPPLGHTPLVSYRQTAASCTSDGIRVTTVTCRICEKQVEQRIEVLEATGHTWEPVVIDGIAKKRCTACGQIFGEAAPVRPSKPAEDAETTEAPAEETTADSPAAPTRPGTTKPSGSLGKFDFSISEIAHQCLTWILRIVIVLAALTLAVPVVILFIRRKGE